MTTETDGSSPKGPSACSFPDSGGPLSYHHLSRVPRPTCVSYSSFLGCFSTVDLTRDFRLFLVPSVSSPPDPPNHGVDPHGTRFRGSVTLGPRPDRTGRPRPTPLGSHGPPSQTGRGLPSPSSEPTLKTPGLTLTLFCTVPNGVRRARLESPGGYGGGDRSSPLLGFQRVSSSTSGSEIGSADGVRPSGTHHNYKTRPPLPLSFS